MSLTRRQHHSYLNPGFSSSTSFLHTTTFHIAKHNLFEVSLFAKFFGASKRFVPLSLAYVPSVRSSSSSMLLRVWGIVVVVRRSNGNVVPGRGRQGERVGGMLRWIFILLVGNFVVEFFIVFKLFLTGRHDAKPHYCGNNIAGTYVHINRVQPPREQDPFCSTSGN